MPVIHVEGAFLSPVTEQEREAVQKRWDEMANDGDYRRHFSAFRQGDGWKYVQARFERNARGGYSIGLTSEDCILLLADRWLRENAHTTLPEFDPPELDPRERITAQRMREIQETYGPLTDPTPKVDLELLLEDLRDINEHSLAEAVRRIAHRSSGDPRIETALDLAENTFGKLDQEIKRRLRAVIVNPTSATWDDAHSILITPRSTLWQAVCAADPDYPKVGPRLGDPWPVVPSRDTILNAIERLTH